MDDDQPHAGDAEERRDGGEPTASAPHGARAQRGRPGPPPLKVRLELVLVDGPEGHYLRQRQAEAIREALRWFAEHPVDPDTHTEHR